MTIETKFNMHQLVYFRYEQKIYCSMVYGIYISYLENKRRIRYDVLTNDKFLSIDEKKLFRTKQELLDSL